MEVSARNLQPILVIVVAVLVLPATGFAAEASDGRWGFWFDAGRVFNLALVLAVLVWAARKPLAGFFASRSEIIREQLAEAQQARREAEAKLAEIVGKMSRLDDELRRIKAGAEKEAQEESRRLAAQAEREADKVLERARQEIAGMTRAAQIELKQHAAQLSVQLAEERIRQEISDEDRKRLFTGFVARMEDRQ